MSSAARVLDVARSQIGTGESPKGSNRQPYGKAYGADGVFWCAQFVWWVLTQAGAGALIPKSASTVTMRDWYMKRGQWHTGTPQPGDLIFFKFKGNNNPVNHIGIVEAVEAKTVITIEGNTAPASGDQRNGDGVYRKRRVSDIVGYARPAYTSSAAPAAALSPPQEAEVLKEDEIRGQGTLRRPIPVGKASSIYAQGWVSLLADGPAGARAKVFFQSDTGGLADRELTATYRDGHSTRAWCEAPDGTTQINVIYDAPDGGLIVREALPK